MKAASSLFPDRNVISVRYRNKIQQPRHDHELRSVIGGGKGNRALAAIHRQRHNIHSAGAQITDESKNVENVAAVRLVNVPLHHESQDKETSNGDEQEQAANPAFLNHVSSAGNQPAYRRS